MTWSHAQLFRNLAIMYKGGVPLERAVDTLRIQWRGQPLGEALERMYLQLCQGRSLSQAGRSVGGPFRDLHVALFRIGEESGGLDESLEVLASYEEESCRLKQQIRSQLAYPILVLGVMLVLLGAGLPWMSRMLPGSISCVPTLLLLGGLLGVGLRHRQLLEWLGRYRPFSDLRRSWATSQFLGLWSGLLDRGIPLAKSLDLAGQASPCPLCSQACQQLTRQVVEGIPLAEAFHENEYFAVSVKGCVVAGLESGRLPRMLKALKLLEDQQVACTIEATVSLLTPLIMAFLGLLLLIFLHQTLTPLMALLNSI